MQAEENPQCDCGNPATTIRNREWICERCKRIEDSTGHDKLKTLCEHNRAAIESHPMARRISMIQGSSIAPEVVAQVVSKAVSKRKVLVCLDSNHTYDHVLAELQAYAPLVSLGSYCVVFDTVVEVMPAEMFPDRPWSPGNSPKTAVMEYLGTHPEFSIDHGIDDKLLLSVAPGGYLKRIG